MITAEKLISCSREFFDYECLKINNHEMISFFYPVEVMKTFSKEQFNYVHKWCHICKRRWSQKTKKAKKNKTKENEKNYTCTECLKFEKIENNHNQNPENEYRHFNPYTKENKMVPCVVPYELKNLSFFEKLLISRINPIMSVVTIENRNLKIKKFKGHTHHKHFTRHHKNCNHPAKTSRRSQNNLDQKEDTERGHIQTIQNKQGENHKGITMAQISQPLLQKHRDRHIKDRKSINTKILEETQIHECSRR